MWATPQESRQQIVSLYRRVWEHSDATLDALPLEAIGHVPWWGDKSEVTLHRSEEHTSELQSHSFISYAVFCLKKKKKHLKCTRSLYRTRLPSSSRRQFGS